MGGLGPLPPQPLPGQAHTKWRRSEGKHKMLFFCTMEETGSGQGLPLREPLL